MSNFPPQDLNVLSVWQRRFLAFIAEHPEAVERSTFQALEGPGGNELSERVLTLDIPIQPWPTLLDGAQMEHFGRMTVDILALVRSIPERFFDLDAARLSDFYCCDPETFDAFVRVLELPWRPGGEFMRGDFYHDGTTLRCLEVNPTSYAGGMMYAQRARALLELPLMQRFFSEQGVHVRCADPWRTMMLFMIDRALARGLDRDGFLNFAIAIETPHDLEPVRKDIEGPYLEMLAERAPELQGKVLFCDYPQLERKDDSLWVAGQPIHMLMQRYNDFMFAPVALEIEAWLDGVVDLYAGPMSWIYHDKRNLALLWEGLDQGLFSREERAVIESHVAWTARVKPGRASYRGEKVDLRSLLIDRQRDLVLKPAQSFGGTGVTVGRYADTTLWRELVDTAFDEETYTVQEYITPQLELHQWGASGVEPCEVNWGLFAFGDRFGGSYLRLHPPVDDGIINIGKGADGACVLEVSREPFARDPREKGWEWSFAREGDA